MSRLLHKLARAIAILAITLALLVGIASSSWFHHILEQRIQASLKDVTDGEVQITGLRVNLLDFRVSLQKLVIRGLEKNSEPPLFSANGIIVKVSPASLLQRQLILRSLEWQQAEVHLWTHPDGSTNLPGSQLAPQKGQNISNLMDLGIHQLVLNATTVFWNNQAFPLEVVARHAAILLRLSPDHQYLGSLASSDAVLKSKIGTSPHVTFGVSFQMSNNQVNISSLDWQVNNLRGKASGAFNWQNQPNGNFDFRTNGGIGELAKALGITAVRQGYLYLDGKGTYSQNGLAVQGRIQLRDLAPATRPFKPGSIGFSSDYRLERQEVTLSGFSLAGLQGRAKGDATVSFRRSTPRFSLHSRLNGISLNALIQAFPGVAGTIGMFHPWSRIDGVATLSGTGRSKTQGQFDLQLSPPQETPSNGIPLSGHAQGSFTLAPHLVVDLNEADISTPHSTVDAQGTFGTAESSLRIKVATTDFEEWRPLAALFIETREPFSLALRSEAIFTGQVSGTLASPQIRGHLDSGEFDLGGWRWDGFQADVQTAPDHVQVTSGRLKLNDSMVTLDARLGLNRWIFDENSLVDLKASARAIPIEGLRAALGIKPSMHGLFTGQIEISGQPTDLSGQGKLTVQKGEFAGVPFDSLSAGVRAVGSAWKIENFKLREERGQASGQLQFDLARRSFSAQFHGQDFSLASLPIFAPEKAAGNSLQTLSGLLNFDLKGGGNFENAQVQSTLDLRDLSWRAHPLGNLHGTANWAGRRIQLQIDGQGALGKVHCGGSIQTQGEWPVQLAGQYTDLRLDPWLELLSSRTTGAQISASGSFNISGPARQPHLVDGHSQVRLLEIGFPDLTLKNEKPIDIQYAAGQLKLNSFRMQGPATNFEMDGSIHFAHPAVLDLTAKGKAAATLLSLASDQFQATGGSDLEIHIGGTLAHPQMEGSLKITNVGIGYGNLPVRVSGLNGNVKLDGDRATVSSLEGSIGGGKFRMSGYVLLENDLRYDLQSDLSHVRLRYPADFTSVLNGTLKLAGTTARSQLTGDISVLNIYANENLNLLDLMSETNNPLNGPQPRVASTALSRINLGVAISSQQPVRIESRDLRVVADIDMRIQGTLANPVAVGDIRLRNGQTIFRGNRYTLTRGDIALTNPFQTEPVLDIEAQTHIDKYDLTLIISGPSDHLRFAFRSDPPLPTEDILSLLAFGYSRQVAQLTQTNKTSFSSTGAGALLSQALSSQVTGRIQRLFGVSRIQYSPYSAAPGALGSPVLTIEQQLSPDLTLTYQTSTANSQYRVIEFDWAVNRRMSVRGFRDQNGIFGLELRFRRRFK